MTDGRGIDARYINESCPAELKPYEKAYAMKIKNSDSLAHAWVGSYGISALIFAIDHCFNKKAKSKYIKNPFVSLEMESKSGLEESNEEVAIFEMKQRIELLRKQGLPESPE